MLDFDGSLSEIVARPELARPAEGARAALTALVALYRVVAIVTGRPSEEIVSRLSVPGLRFYGLYGMEDAGPELLLGVAAQAEAAVAGVPEAWVEDKRASVAVHYRGAPDPAAARVTLAAELRAVASEHGLAVVEGKMVLELVPRNRPMKGGAVERLAGEHALEAVLYAGDDVADVDAFEALDRLEDRGVAAVRVAVHGPETPRRLVEAADVVVEGPVGLVELLRELG